MYDTLGFVCSLAFHSTQLNDMGDLLAKPVKNLRENQEHLFAL